MDKRIKIKFNLNSIYYIGVYKSREETTYQLFNHDMQPVSGVRGYKRLGDLVRRATKILACSDENWAELEPCPSCGTYRLPKHLHQYVDESNAAITKHSQVSCDECVDRVNMVASGILKEF